MTEALEERIDVCICTFRRTSLIDALKSLTDAKADLPVSVLVIDNDETESARAVTEAVAATSHVPVRYVHCPGANISIARNAALARSRARFLAFLDDDETAGRDWMSHLRRTMRDSGATVVLGPVQAVYGNDDPSWMQRANVHSTLPVFINGEIKTGYSCNVLIDRQDPAFAGLRFRVDLGRSGGEDTAFFTEAYERGAQISFAPEAVVYEAVTSERARFGWLAKRRYRMGQTHGRLLLGRCNGPKAILNLTLAMIKTAYCAGAAVVSAFDPVERNRAILRGCLHAGTISAHLGLRSIQLYGQNSKGMTP